MCVTPRNLEVVHEPRLHIHDAFACVTWLIHLCDKIQFIHSWVWHDAFISGTCLIHTCDITHSCVCDMTHLCVWRDSFMCVTQGHAWNWSTDCVFICLTWRIHKWDMTHSYVWHHSFIRVTQGHVESVLNYVYTCVMMTWRIHMWDMTHSYVGHDSFICVTQGRVELQRELPLHLFDMMHSNVGHILLIHMCDTGPCRMRAQNAYACVIWGGYH